MLLEALVSFCGIFVLLIFAGIAYQQYGLRQDRRRYLPPGRLVALPNRRLHIRETGFGKPAVIFESGLASSSLSWTLVQEIVARNTLAISYDRAGIGWSDDTRERRTVSNVIRDLRTLLVASGNRPPYVLVGHSFGALLARAYASKRGEDVAGLVLVDPVSLAFWADCSEKDVRRLRLGVKLSRRGVLLAKMGVVRLALASLASGRTRISKTIARASAGKALGTVRRLTGSVQKLPPALRPFVQSHWSRAESFRALAEYLEILRPCASEVRAMAIPSDVPLTILSASDATAQELAERKLWAGASVRGRHIVIADTGHWIQLDQPQEVADAILEMVQYLRESRSSPSLE